MGAGPAVPVFPPLSSLLLRLCDEFVYANLTGRRGDDVKVLSL